MRKIKIGLENNNETLIFSKDDIIQIILPENPTTGYLWYIDEESQEYLTENTSEMHEFSNAIGSARNRVFEILIKNKKSAVTIKLKNMRIWNNEIIQTFQFNYLVENNTQP